MNNGTSACEKTTSVHFNAWCVGLFLLISFPTAVSLLLLDSDTSTENWVFYSLPTLVRALAFAIGALLANKNMFLATKQKSLMIFSFIMAAGALGKAGAFTWYSGSVLLWISFTSSMALNIGYAALYLGWMNLYSQMDTKHVVLYFTSAHFLSAFTSYCLFSIGSSIPTVLLVAAMPTVSVGMLRAADARTKDAPYRQGETQRIDWSISPRPLLLLAAFSFSNSVIRGFLGTEDQATVLLGVCAAALCLLIIVIRRFDKFEIRLLYQIAVPILVAGALFVPIDGNWWRELTAAFCSNAAFALFSIFVTAIFCNIAYRYGVNAVWLFGVTQASLSFGSFFGKSFSLWSDSLPFSPPVATMAMSIIVIVLVTLSMFLASDRDFATTWGITDVNEQRKKQSLVDEEERLAQTCAHVAQRYSLTRREEEVLVLMMRGYTLSRIGDVLFIADSTMKTHSQHIYRKVGVQNRRELQELVSCKYRRK